MENADSANRIRKVLKEHARLNEDPFALQDGADLYRAGMTSHATVNVMLALEGEFNIEFPDKMLRRNVFDSVESIRAAVETLSNGG